MMRRPGARHIARAGSGVVALLLAAASCGEYQPTNPYDMRFANTLTLEGPDTTQSVGQVVSFTVDAVPAWPDAKAVWASSNPAALQALGGGRFQVMSATHDDEFATVTATLGTKMVSRSIRVRQRAAKVRVEGVTHGLLLDSTFATALGARMLLAVWLDDSTGHYIPDTLASGHAVATIVVRDTTVAAFDAGSLYSRGAGRTWIVGTADGRIDSLVVHVVQYPATVQTTLGTVQLNPGDSARITITGWLDANGYALANAPTVLGWRVVPAFTGTSSVSTVTQDGVVHVNPQNGKIGVDVIQVQWAMSDGSSEGWLNAGTVFVGQGP